MINHDAGRRVQWWNWILRPGAVFLALAIGLSAMWIAFFGIPVFLGLSREMQFPEYIPIIRPIGEDLALMLSYVRDWLMPGGLPYGGANPYPPLAMVLFWPLTKVDPRLAFAVMSGLTLGAYVWCAGIFPYLAASQRRISPSAALLFGVGLFSYPLHFEIERGQFNLIAVGLALAGVLVARQRGKIRLLGYVLITAGIQLKMYPAVIALALIGDWSNPRDLRRVLPLLAANAALFFVLGPSTFCQFVASVLRQVSLTGVWLGNHSIASFAALVGAELTERGIAGAGVWRTGIVIAGVSGIIASAAVLGVATRRDSQRGLDAHLLLSLLLIGVLLPSVSHDYTLAALLGPLGLVLSEEEAGGLGVHAGPLAKSSFVRLGTLLAMCASFSTVLFSFAYKPSWLANNMPFLFVMLLATVVLRWMRSGAVNRERESPVETLGDRNAVVTGTR